jgi:DNA-binding GntR family transcriptional regulator
MLLDDDTRSSPVSRDLLGQKIANLLRPKILEERFLPGTRLVEDNLAIEFGTSRGPIRHAFVLLAQEGLLTTIAGKGTYVRGLTPETIRQLSDVRTVLETYAVEMAIQGDTDEQLRRLKETALRMVEAAKRFDFNDYVRLDGALHRQIWELSGNE